MAISTGGNVRRNLSGKQAKIAMGALIFIGLLFAGIGLLIGLEGFRTSGWTSAQGTVTNVETDQERVRRGNDRPSRTATFYKPTFRYEAAGQQYTASSSTGTETVLSPGDQIDIKYNPGTPSEAVYVSGQSNFLSIMFIGIGLFVAVVGVVVLISLSRRGATA